jgi:hypothetical protein
MPNAPVGLRFAARGETELAQNGRPGSGFSSDEFSSSDLLKNLLPSSLN